MGNDNNKFPTALLECIESTSNGNYLRVAGDTFWQQRLIYHSASAGVDGQVEYIGFARPGVGISASGWAIKRLTYDASGNVTQITWAGSSLAINKIFDDRTEYVYG
jgi:YD repeat-containing protein